MELGDADGSQQYRSANYSSNPNRGSSKRANFVYPAARFDIPAITREIILQV